MKSKKIAKILGMGLSAGLVFALVGTIFAGPAAADQMKWTPVNTPSWADYVIFPDSDVLDYAVGGETGDTVYAVTGRLPAPLVANGNGSAAWSTDNVCLGDRSAMLIGGAQTGSDYAALVLYINGALTLPEVTEFVYTYYFESDSANPLYGGPHMCFYTHDPNDGETADITLYSGDAGPPPGLPADAGLHTQVVNGSTPGFFWYGSETTFGGLTEGLPNMYTLNDFQTTADFSSHVVDRIQIEYGWWGSGDASEPAYVSNITINGATGWAYIQESQLLKSEDGGVTWTNITAKALAAANLPAAGFASFTHVAVAGDDEDWVALAGVDTTGVPVVIASQDGGTNFSYTGAMTDGADTMGMVYDLAVSIEVSDIHNIAVAGIATTGGSVFRLKAGTWLSAAWEDTTDANYLGWDNGVTGATAGVVACAFSDNFDIDDTIVCLGINGIGAGLAYLQSGIWESTAGSWNSQAGFPNAAEIKSNGDTLMTGVYQRSVGLTLPADYDGSDPGARAVFLYVNAYNTSTNLVGGCVFRADNNALSPVCGPPGDPLLASIDVHGDADTGKLMIGEYIRWDNDAGDPGEPLRFNCCEGVRVWHTEELDFCCPQWDGACKDPSGPYMAVVTYTPDGEKAYATTSGALDMEYPGFGFFGGLGDESAFSVTRDDGVSFNQLSLIDTDIDYLADVAVCPDCSTIYLASVNYDDDYELCCDEETEIYPVCECDSVWRSYDDGDTWERVFHGDWVTGIRDTSDTWLLLRLPCDAIEDCCDQDPVSPSGTVYLGIYNSDEIFYSRDCGQCWNDPPATKLTITDFCVETENIVYVTDHDNGDFSMSTQYGRRWSDPVDTGLDTGHNITCCCDQGLIVIGPCYCGSIHKVAWSDDGGENWNLTDQLPSAGRNGAVHVACDPVCENIIYAAVDGVGIYRTDITDGAWTNINALPIDYTGIVMAREGTLYASTDELIVDDGDDTPLFTDCKGRDFIAPAAYDTDGTDDVYSGVARNLDPCVTACCGTEDWDYLLCGLSPSSGESDPWWPGEDFDMWPDGALRICGCLSTDTNSVLWAIDTDPYVVDHLSSYYQDGALWSYEDCAAKLGPELTSPEDGAVLDCEPCAGCDAANFTLKWERICIACSYDIQIMDEAGNIIVEWVDVDIVGDPPSLFVDGTMEVDSDVVAYVLECGNNYTWRVRMANTDCECVHSPWSETWSFTIAVGAADAIQLLAPVKGALDVPTESIGFSWTAVRNASSYSFVLSPNADLTGALVSQDLSGTAFNYAGPLDYSTAYYWQIIAWEDGTRLTTSAIGVFNTMAEPEEPTPPVEVTTTPAPVINIPPAEQITPIWIYAIIGIGAALAVVVIVLIVRTRRP